VRSADVPLETREIVQHPSRFTPLISRYLHQLYQTQDGRETLDQYLNLIQQLLTASPSVVPLACLLELVGSVPDLLSLKFIDKLNWLKVITFSVIVPRKGRSVFWLLCKKDPSYKAAWIMPQHAFLGGVKACHTVVSIL